LNQRLSDDAKRDRRRYRLKNENVGEKNMSVERKIEKVIVVSSSRGLQKQSRLTARRYDVGLT